MRMFNPDTRWAYIFIFIVAAILLAIYGFWR